MLGYLLSRLFYSLPYSVHPIRLRTLGVAVGRLLYEMLYLRVSFRHICVLMNLLTFPDCGSEILGSSEELDIGLSLVGDKPQPVLAFDLLLPSPLIGGEREPCAEYQGHDRQEGRYPEIHAAEAYAKRTVRNTKTEDGRASESLIGGPVRKCRRRHAPTRRASRLLPAGPAAAAERPPGRMPGACGPGRGGGAGAPPLIS